MRKRHGFGEKEKEMSKKKKEKMEFRYYELPPGMPLLALLGEKWMHSVTMQSEHDCLHFHNYMEIGYCYRGEGKMILEDAEHSEPFQGEMFTIIPKNYPHATINVPGTESSWEYLFIDADSFLKKYYEANPRRAENLLRLISQNGQIFSVVQEPIIAGIIRQIIEVMREMDEYYLDEIRGLLLVLLLEIAKISKKESESKNGSEKNQPVISRVLDYISDNYSQEIRVQELAQLCHISETHFRRVFSACMQMTPAEYINLVRIRMACEMMKKTNDSMSVIANRVGFDVLSTFNRNFKKIMGVSPSEWRRSPENWEGKLLNFDIRTEEGW